MPCYYDCVDGRGVPIYDTCPAHNCPQDVGPCYAPDTVYHIACPPPFPLTQETEHREEEAPQ